MRTVLLLSILAAASCMQSPPDSQKIAARNRGDYAVWLSSRLNVSAQSDIEGRLKAPFTEGAAHPPDARNCVEMLALGDRGAGSPNHRNFLEQRSTLVECTVLQQLQHAAPARSSFVADLPWDEKILPLLPPQFAINVSDENLRAAAAAVAAGKSWTDVDRSAIAAVDGPDRVTVKGDAFIVRLILWGRGDFNGDGVQDLLVQTLDTLTEGTYRYTRLYILTRQNDGAKLSVVRQLL